MVHLWLVLARSMDPGPRLLSVQGRKNFLMLIIGLNAYFHLRPVHARRVRLSVVVLFQRCPAVSSAKSCGILYAINSLSLDTLLNALRIMCDRECATKSGGWPKR